jgi:hypothetical protein
MSVSLWRLWQRRQELQADADVKVAIKPAADTAAEMKVTRRRLPGARGMCMHCCACLSPAMSMFMSEKFARPRIEVGLEKARTIP